MRKRAALRFSSGNLMLLDWLAGQQHLSHWERTWVRAEAKMKSILIPLGWFTHTHTRILLLTFNKINVWYDSIYKSYFGLGLFYDAARDIDPCLNDTTAPLKMNLDCVDLAGITRRPLCVDGRWVFFCVSHVEYEGHTHTHTHCLNERLGWRLSQASFQVNS